MHALEVRPETLDWESERHNRVAQRDQRAKIDEVRSRLQLVDAPVSAPWLDKLQAIPAMRAALIPQDESLDRDTWSKPFSLIKADFEPWLSFYAGYRSSRLFLDAAKPVPARPAVLDFPIQALLDLKKVDPRLIVEPPVQIDGPVEYFDPARAPRSERGMARTPSLTRAAEAMHRGQLRRAVERGRDMGNRLHDALLGDGMVNLVRAWEKVHQRKPSVHELHIMLTTGRTVPVQPRISTPIQETRPTAVAQRAAMMADARTPRPAESAPPAQAAHPVAMAVDQIELKQVQLPVAPGHSLFWYLAHAVALTCAGALIYLLAA